MQIPRRRKAKICWSDKAYVERVAQQKAKTIWSAHLVTSGVISKWSLIVSPTLVFRRSSLSLFRQIRLRGRKLWFQTRRAVRRKGAANIFGPTATCLTCVTSASNQGYSSLKNSWLRQMLLGSERLMKTSSRRTLKFTLPGERPRIGTCGDKSSVRQRSDRS